MATLKTIISHYQVIQRSAHPQTSTYGQWMTIVTVDLIQKWLHRNGIELFQWFDMKSILRYIRVWHLKNLLTKWCLYRIKKTVWNSWFDCLYWYNAALSFVIDFLNPAYYFLKKFMHIAYISLYAKTYGNCLYKLQIS